MRFTTAATFLSFNQLQTSAQIYMTQELLLIFCCAYYKLRNKYDIYQINSNKWLFMIIQILFVYM